MSDSDGGAPDSPESGDTDTTSLYGTPPQGAPDDGTDEADEVAADEQAAPRLGEEDDLNQGSTGALPEG